MRCTPVGDPRVAAPDRCPETLCAEASTADSFRPSSLDLALLELVRVALRAGHRQSRNRFRLAPEGLSTVLDLEDSAGSDWIRVIERAPSFATTDSHSEVSITLSAKAEASGVFGTYQLSQCYLRSHLGRCWKFSTSMRSACSGRPSYGMVCFTHRRRRAAQRLSDWGVRSADGRWCLGADLVIGFSRCGQQPPVPTEAVVDLNLLCQIGNPRYSDRTGR